jgi:putative flippase GtrA
MTLFMLFVTGLHVAPLLANTLSYCIGTLNAFFCNKYWTFAQRGGEKSITTQLPMFFVLYLVGLLISNLIIWALSGAVPILVAKIIATGGSMTWNYLSIRNLVYASTEPAGSVRQATPGPDFAQPRRILFRTSGLKPKYVEVEPKEGNSMARSVPFQYRLILAVFLLTAFVFFWGLREFQLLSVYDQIHLFLGVHANVKIPFSDFHAILAAAECHRLGVDVYVTNPCDFAGRPHIYSPLWLQLPWLDTADTWWAGAVLTILFLLSLAWLCPARSKREFLLFLVLCCSSAVVFAASRANNDIIVFLLTLTAGKIFSSQKLRPFSYASVLLAAALKFYPIAAFSMLVADTPRRALLYGGVAIGAAIGLAFHWQREIAVAAEHFPTAYLVQGDMFSARNLIGTLLTAYPLKLSFLGPHTREITALLILLAVLAAAGMAIILRRSGVRLFLEPEETVLFLAGGAMIVGCFFAGHNIHYRAISLLLTLPLLLQCTRNASTATRLTGWTGIGLVAFAVFENFLRMNLINVFRAINVPEYHIALIFWGVEQMVWWTLVTGLMAALLLIAWDSPTGLWVRRNTRFPFSAFIFERSPGLKEDQA